MIKRAIIWGVTGQDGSYLSELLLSKGYQVIGVKRRSSVSTTWRIDHLMNHPDFKVVEGDITDYYSVYSITDKYVDGVYPVEIYNLAAQSHVGTSFEQPHYTTDSIYKGTMNLLNVVKEYGGGDVCRVYNAASSEMYGNAPKNHVHMYDEKSRMRPESPYAIAKLAGFQLCQLYRKAYGVHVSSGILFNHESPRRGELFLTRKVTKYVATLYDHLTVFPHVDFFNDHKKLQLGNLESSRDWAHAKDYVYGMWLMLQQEIPDDYVLATGHTYTVKDFVQRAFAVINQDYTDYIEIDESLKRPSEVNLLIGDATKARARLGWDYKFGLNDLIRDMIKADSALYVEETVNERF